MVTIDDVRAAAQRIERVALKTPLIPFRDGSYIKAESLQPTGSFKIRGAYNALAQLNAEQRAKGVVAHSSGNHAQAVARAARLLGLRAVVVMPNTAPTIKVEGVRRDGAEIVFVGPANEERVARAHEIAHDDGMVLVSSANHEHVVAGQGTIGLEISAQLEQMEVTDPPIVLSPLGLGGLAAGISIGLAWTSPQGQVWGVEPELAADTKESLERGELTPWPAEKVTRTIADGLRGEAPSPIPFEILKQNIAGVITVAEEEIVDAMRVAAREAKLVLEPSGATSLAALLHHRDELPSGAVVAIASGGNVDQPRYAEWLAGG